MCDLEAGTCVDASEVIYASVTGTANDQCPGTAAAPCDLTNGFGKVSTTRSIVKLLPGTYVTNDFVIDTKHVTIHGEGATMTCDDSLVECLTIKGTAAVTIDGLHMARGIAAGVNPAMSCGDPTSALHLDGVEFDVPQNAVQAACSGTIKRSHFVARSASGSGSALLLVLFNNVSQGGTGLAIDRTRFEGGSAIAASTQSDVTVTNSIFVNSGLFGYFQTPSGAGRVSFSTFLNSPVDCGSGHAAPTGLFSNNVLFSTKASDVASGSNCSHEYEILLPQKVVLSVDHILNTDPLFRDVAAGDVRPAPSSPAIDAGDPKSTISIDFNGAARPLGNGFDLGAFEVSE